MKISGNQGRIQDLVLGGTKFGKVILLSHMFMERMMQEN